MIYVMRAHNHLTYKFQGIDINLLVYIYDLSE